MGAKLVPSAQVKSEGAEQEEMPALPGNPTLPLAECAGKQFATPTCSHSKLTFLSLRAGRIWTLTPPPGSSQQRLELRGLLT